MKTIAYVYKWTELSTGKWYIGSRTAKNCHPNDGYICSSKIVKPLIKSNPENWKREILEIGEPLEMRELESEILTCLDAAKSEYSYNQTNGDGKFCTTGKKASEETRNKLSSANKGENNPMFNHTYTEETLNKLRKPKTKEHCSNISKSWSDERKEQQSKKMCGENNPMFNYEWSDEQKNNMSMSRIGDKNGMFGKTHSEESKKKMSDKLKGTRTGISLSEETKIKMSLAKRVNQKIVTCPHCGKDGGVSNMKRYHFDKCKIIQKVESKD